MQQKVETLPSIGTHATSQGNLKDSGSVFVKQQVGDDADSRKNNDLYEGASIMNVTANICKTGLGIGIVMMPEMFMKCGLFGPIFLIIAIGLFSFYGWYVLGLGLCEVRRQLKEKNIPIPSSLTLDEAMGIVFSPFAKAFTQVINGTCMFLSSIAYAIYIIAQIKEYIFDSSLISSIVICMFFLPTQLSRNIDGFSIFSKFGLLVLVFVIIVILSSSFSKIFLEAREGGDNENEKPLVYFNLEYVAQNLGIILVSFDINGTVSTIHATMKQKEKFWLPLSMYLTFSAVMSCMVGMVAYTAFGDSITSSIFNQVIKEFSHIGIIAQILYSLSLILNISLFGFVLTKTLDAVVFRRESSEEARKSVPFYQWYGVRVVYIMLIIGIANLFHNVSFLLNITGCFVCTILTFVLPCLLYEKVFAKNAKKSRKFINYPFAAIMIIIGIIGLCLLFKAQYQKTDQASLASNNEQIEEMDENVEDSPLNIQQTNEKTTIPESDGTGVSTELNTIEEVDNEIEDSENTRI